MNGLGWKSSGSGKNELSMAIICMGYQGLANVLKCKGKDKE